MTDLEWAPSGTDLAIASNGISIYSVATDHLSRLGADGAQSISWAPDGSRIAFEKLRPGSTEVDDLWLINADGPQKKYAKSPPKINPPGQPACKMFR